MKRCSRCLLPETYPNIRYNGEDVCNYCLTYTLIEYKGEPKLEELLDTSRNRNKGEKYDCVVAVSGGRDSTFMVYELVEAYDMRVLAYNYDNGFVSEQAKLNLKKMTDALGVDLVINLRLSPIYIRERKRQNNDAQTMPRWLSRYSARFVIERSLVQIQPGAWLI
jgi:tRNA(Ile)-lysidine synthase TilS/MesJ